MPYSESVSSERRCELKKKTRNFLGAMNMLSSWGYSDMN